MKRYEVLFQPDNLKVRAEDEMTVLDAAFEGGIFIPSTCGGMGRCGRCKVKIEGATKSESSEFITKEEWKEGIRLACRSFIQEDLLIEVPAEVKEGGFQILGTGEVPLPPKLEPLVRKIYLELTPPTIKDNLSDLERMEGTLSSLGVKAIFPLSLLKDLSSTLRRHNWKVWLTLIEGEGFSEAIRVEGGEITSRIFGLAVDIGTTTVVTKLIDLNSWKVIDTKSSYNRQISCGEDLLSRIAYAERGGTERLHQLIIDTINELISDIAKKDKIQGEEILVAAIAGNTTMIHLLLGINPSPIRYEPHIGTADLPPIAKGSELGLHMHPQGSVFCLPGRGGFLGGDVVSDIVASSLHKRKKPSLLIDVGTNGEVVLGCKDWLIGCSASAGPAFEGGEVRHGMRAVSGAIDKVEITGSYETLVRTIEGEKPRGLCGSGLINLLSEMLVHKIIDKKGRILEKECGRIKSGEEGKEFVVVWARDGGIGKDITVNEVDIQNLIRTKAAIFAATRVLVRSMNLEFEDMSKAYISGAFGNYVNLEKAILIGLFPDIPSEKYQFIGNGAITGACLSLLSRKKWEESKDISKKLTYLDLSTNKEFFEEFTSSLFLPHTDLDLFPRVRRILG